MGFAMNKVTGQSGHMRHVFVSGDLALDLAGTLKWRHTEPEELLGSVGDLGDWLVQADLLDAVPTPTVKDLMHSLRLREAVYVAAAAQLGGAAIPQASVDHLNAVSGGPQVAHVIVDGALCRTGDVTAALGTLARGATVTVAGPDAHLLRECARPGCTRIFVDRSRGALRRWCGMAECGSQQKMAAYRARLRGGVG